MKSYLRDLGALVLAFLLGVFVKLEIKALLGRIEQYSAVLESVNLSSDSYIALMQMEQYIESFSSLVTVAYILIIVVLPLGLYLLFCLSQGINFRMYFKKKVNLLYLLKFFILGLPFFFVLVFLFSNMFDLFFVTLNSYFDILLFFVYFLIFVLLGYVWFSFAVLLAKDRLKWSQKLLKVFRWKRILWFLFGFVVTSLMLGLIFVMFVNLITWSFYDGYFWFVVVVLGLLWVLGFVRNKFLGTFK